MSQITYKAPVVELRSVSGLHDLDQACYGHAMSPFGPAVVVWSSGGLLALWLDALDSGEALTAVRERFAVDVSARSDKGAQQWLETVFDSTESDLAQGQALPVLVHGTPFELQVWQALCEIPHATVRSYGELATEIGRPGAARAVGSAVARNCVAFLIPCHRVVRQSGQTGQFRWGENLKRDLIAWEVGR